MGEGGNPGMMGFINVYKEPGQTSHDVVGVVRRIISMAYPAGAKVRVGHCGTLDPAAEGVLVVCVGRATKLADYVGEGEKCYRAILKLGQTSDTQDSTGQILSHCDVRCSKQDVAGVVESFTGDIEQLPPMYSAVKVGGKKLYELARRGQTAERKPRRVRIHGIKIMEFLDDTSCVIEVHCSRGTYIRTLCADIGERLGCGGLMGGLVRTSSGVFDIRKAIKLSELEELAHMQGFERALVTVEEALALPEAVVAKEAAKALVNGRDISEKLLVLAPAKPHPGMRVLIRGHDGVLAGLHEYRGQMGSMQLRQKVKL